MKRRLLPDAAVNVPQEPLRIAKLGHLDEMDLPIEVRRVTPSLVRDEVLDQSESLDNLTTLALAKADEILRLELIPGDEDFGTILRAQVAQVQAVLTTQARVDEGRFKKKQADKLGELLTAIEAFENAKTVNGERLN